MNKKFSIKKLVKSFKKNDRQQLVDQNLNQNDRFENEEYSNQDSDDYESDSASEIESDAASKTSIDSIDSVEMIKFPEIKNTPNIIKNEFLNTKPSTSKIENILDSVQDYLMELNQNSSPNELINDDHYDTTLELIDSFNHDDAFTPIPAEKSPAPLPPNHEKPPLAPSIEAKPLAAGAELMRSRTTKEHFNSKWANKVDCHQSRLQEKLQEKISARTLGRNFTVSNRFHIENSNSIPEAAEIVTVPIPESVGRVAIPESAKDVVNNSVAPNITPIRAQGTLIVVEQNTATVIMPTSQPLTPDVHIEMETMTYSVADSMVKVDVHNLVTGLTIQENDGLAGDGSVILSPTDSFSTRVVVGVYENSNVDFDSMHSVSPVSPTSGPTDPTDSTRSAPSSSDLTHSTASNKQDQRMTALPGLLNAIDEIFDANHSSTGHSARIMRRRTISLCSIGSYQDSGSSFLSTLSSHPSSFYSDRGYYQNGNQSRVGDFDDESGLTKSFSTDPYGYPTNDVKLQEFHRSLQRQSIIGDLNRSLKRHTRTSGFGDLDLDGIFSSLDNLKQMDNQRFDSNDSPKRNHSPPGTRVPDDALKPIYETLETLKDRVDPDSLQSIYNALQNLTMQDQYHRPLSGIREDEEHDFDRNGGLREKSLDYNSHLKMKGRKNWFGKLSRKFSRSFKQFKSAAELKGN